MDPTLRFFKHGLNRPKLAHQKLVKGYSREGCRSINKILVNGGGHREVILHRDDRASCRLLRLSRDSYGKLLVYLPGEWTACGRVVSSLMFGKGPARDLAFIRD